MGSSKVFLNGLTETADVEYCQVINSTLERLMRTCEPQMVVTMGSADLRSLTRLAGTFSCPRLTTVYSALLPLILTSEDGLTHNNLVSGQMRSIILTLSCSSVSSQS